MADAKFRETAPKYMRMLMADFGLGLNDAAAVFGNLGHESAGFTKMQEENPVSGRGGYGWAQWTGPRRADFEAYCERNGYDPDADLTNYKFLFVELSGSEKKAIPALKAADTLDDKVVAFEKAFERAGVKHYDSRKAWAKTAKEAYLDAYGNAEPPEIPEEPEEPPVTPPVVSRAYPDPVTEPQAAIAFGLGLIIQALPNLRRKD